MNNEGAFAIVEDIIVMINRDEEVRVIKDRLQDLYHLGYRRGVAAGQEDQRSRDWASSHGHDMGQ